MGVRQGSPVGSLVAHTGGYRDGNDLDAWRLLRLRKCPKVWLISSRQILIKPCQTLIIISPRGSPNNPPSKPEPKVVADKQTMRVDGFKVDQQKRCGMHFGGIQRTITN